MTDRSQRLSFDRPLTRRRFTRAIAWTGLGTAALGLAPFPSEAAPPAPKKLLDESSFVYISPLKRDGGESSCHGELWYAWLDDAVVVIVGHPVERSFNQRMIPHFQRRNADGNNPALMTMTTTTTSTTGEQ